MSQELIYFADPMCSWCWGFAPVVEQVRVRYGARLPLRLILGGLSVGTTKPLDPRGKATIREHWEHVAELAGQPFDFGFFEREDFVYDTGPACRAVVTARRLRPEQALDFLNHLQRGFYAENRDVSDRATLVAAAEEFGLDGAAYAAAYDDEATWQETLADFRITRNTGIDGYPALLAGDREAGYVFVTLGYQPWPRIEGVLESWRESRGQAAPS